MHCQLVYLRKINASKKFQKEKNETFFLTFHDVDNGADVALLDDERSLRVLHGVHAVHDLLDLRHATEKTISPA
jgi:hypothetical protein